MIGVSAADGIEKSDGNEDRKEHTARAVFEDGHQTIKNNKTNADTAAALEFWFIP